MRGRKAAINTIFGLLEEAVAVICGFILPRLILTAFGSKYNGLTTSITQFLSCAILLRSGIGGATRAALYKPIADEDHEQINSIVKATDIFMKRVGLILAGAILVFAAVYPFLVKNEFGWMFSFTLFLIIGVSTFAESFFGITYLIVLQADQRLWISSLLKSLCYIANTVIGIILIKMGSSIHIVKLGSALVFVLYPIILGMYVKKRYRINTHCKPNMIAISQRWDSFWHQVALFVMNNTDVMVLTVFTNMLEVSVYSVYNMVVHALRRLVTSFSNGLEAAFGNMIAKKENKTLRENLAVIEIILYSLATILYTSATIMIFKFVRIYTKSVEDVDYIRPVFGYLVLIAGFFYAVRFPCQLVVQAAGHYKQTKKGAIIEPIINIVLSVIFVFAFGLVGVAVGTVAATIFRTFQYSEYMRRNIVHRGWYITPMRIFVSICEAGLTILVIHFLCLSVPNGYFMWFVQGVVTFCICSVIVFLGNIICFRKDTFRTFAKIKNVIKPKKSS